jgi:AraC-like DNA-binding protein
MDLVFGWRTAVLSVAAGILLPLAVSLWRAMRNRVAARTLAAVLVAMVGVFVPWLIGFAGFYDAWRWLTFLPVANALLVPPLLYLHTYSLAHGGWPRSGWRHLVPGTIQFLYQVACFALPLPLKLEWARRSLPVTEPAIALLLAASFLAYGVQSMRLLRRYRRAVARQRSDDALFAADWLQRSIAAIGLLALIWAAFLTWDAVSPLGYFGLMPLYVSIAGFALYLGIAGWRYLAVGFPTFAEVEVPERSGPERDWAALGAAWEERVRGEGWYRQESITLRQLAALLGTNSSYLSRALNEGLGVGFSDFINAMRCDEVAQALRDGSPRPVLELALDAGFASKASFNRCFRSRFGQAPSGLRGQGLTS